MTEKIAQINTKKLFWILISIFALCAVFYIYAINVTVRNVVARENFENEISELNLSIGKLEFEYIAKRNAVTLPMAYAMGFQDVKDKTFISSAKVSLASNISNEI